MRRRYLLPFAVLAATFALSVGDAFALSPVINDCTQHSKLTRHYTIPELQHALATLPVNIREYTNCFTVISDQLNRQLGVTKASSSGTGSGGSFLPTPVVIALILIVFIGGGFVYSSRKRGSGGGGTPPSAGGDS
jgi:hypothetical protein